MGWDCRRCSNSPSITATRLLASCSVDTVWALCHKTLVSICFNQQVSSCCQTYCGVQSSVLTLNVCLVRQNSARCLRASQRIRRVPAYQFLSASGSGRPWIWCHLMDLMPLDGFDATRWIRGPSIFSHVPNHSQIHSGDHTPAYETTHQLYACDLFWFKSDCAGFSFTGVDLSWSHYMLGVS